MVLNYQELVASYTRNLNETLRSFSVGPQFLDTWVHDEDDAKSIFGIFDAACVANINEDITVEVPVQTRLDWKRLETELSSLAPTELKKEGDFVLVCVKLSQKKVASRSQSKTQAPKTAREQRIYSDKATGVSKAFGERTPVKTVLGEVLVHPLYHQTLSQADLTLERAGKIEQDGKATLIEHSEKQGLLSCLLDSRGKILMAKHQTDRPVSKLLLDQFCLTIEGLPVQEASEHGVLRLEKKLRDPSLPIPVDGIVAAENTEPEFGLALRLVRGVFRQWVEQTGKVPKRNFYTDPIDSQWLKLPKTTKIEKISNSLKKACRKLGLQETIEVVELKAETRAVLHYQQDPTKPPFHEAMIQLERHLKDELGQAIELLMAEVVDVNKRDSSRKDSDAPTQPS